MTTGIHEVSNYPTSTSTQDPSRLSALITKYHDLTGDRMPDGLDLKGVIAYLRQKQRYIESEMREIDSKIALLS